MKTNSQTYFHPPAFDAENREIAPFDELIVSWNGFRPAGGWKFYIALYQEKWSPWLLYAEWSQTGQRTFQNEGTFAKTYQDAASPKSGYCTGYRIKIEGDRLASPPSFWVCSSLFSQYTPLLATERSVPRIPLRGRSQMLLSHPRSRSLCSPTSTTNAIQFLSPNPDLDPVRFAAAAHDNHFDIYGNWILNTAAAYEQLGGRYKVYVSRLSAFDELLDFLSQNLPVVVSVKGTIEGAPQSYPNGHLICVAGYDAKAKKVHCVDPACPQDSETQIDYPIESFLAAWNARRNLAYLFIYSFHFKEPEN